MTGESIDQAEKLYVEACMRRLLSDIARTESDLKLSEQKLSDCSRLIVEETRRSRESRLKLGYLDQWQVSEEARHLEEFDRLLQVEGVRKVQVTDDVLRVFTDTVYAVHDGARYEIGDFRIDIFFEGYVLARNLRNCGDNPIWDHPHIVNGAICMGNIREGVVKLIGEYQFSVVAQVMLDFLRSYNQNDSYCPITRWRRVEG